MSNERLAACKSDCGNSKRAERTEAVDDDLADARDGLVPLELGVTKARVGRALHTLELRKGHAGVHVAHGAAKSCCWGGHARPRVGTVSGTALVTLLASCGRGRTLSNGTGGGVKWCIDGHLKPRARMTAPVWYTHVYTHTTHNTIHDTQSPCVHARAPTRALSVAAPVFRFATAFSVVAHAPPQTH